MRRLIVHGGAGTIPAERSAEVLAGLQEATEAGWARIDDAQAAVVAAVAAMERSGGFNCGRGAVLNLQGRVLLDAAVARGDGRTGAVANLSRTSRAVEVAVRVMEESPHVLLSGPGADLFARAMGFRAERLGTPRRRALYRKLRTELVDGEGTRGTWSDARPASHPAWWTPLRRLVAEHPELLHGTVGAVALDARGRLAAATSTGGIFLKMDGRVSDSALFGCGTYADRDVGVSATGIGEAIVRATLARSLAEAYRRERGSLGRALDRVVHAMPPDTVGVIALDRKGRFGIAKNTENLAYACRSEGRGSFRSGVD